MRMKNFEKIVSNLKDFMQIMSLTIMLWHNIVIETL